MSAHPDTPQDPLKRVLALEGPEFLGQAYLLLLGRPIDPDGFRNYDAQLRSGTSKLSILAELHASPEGRAYGVDIQDLLPLLAQAPNAIAVANDIHELLALDDVAFINCAYRTLLRRTPDGVGLDHYLKLIRSGAHRMRIVCSLYFSAEGRAVAPRVHGLRRALCQYWFASSWLTGWWYRPIMQVEGDTPFERRLRAIENAVMRMAREREKESSDLDSAVDDVARLLNALTARRPA